MAGQTRTAIPETRYALNGDVHLAYQTLGQGPPDILSVISGPGSHVEQLWEEPAIARATRRIATYGRLILFDQRGNGLSDPVSPREVPTMDQHVDDIRAVLDEVGSKRAVLMGYLAGNAFRRSSSPRPTRNASNRCSFLVPMQG